MRILRFKGIKPAYGIGLYLKPNTAILFHLGKRIIELQFAHEDWKTIHPLKVELKRR